MTTDGHIFVDLASGTAGGAAQLLVGHPFDTCKVGLQRSSGNVSVFAATRNIIESQGLSGLYRGMGPPLASVALFNAMLFSVNGVLSRLVRPDGGTLTPGEAALTGGLAGIPMSLLATPTELLKCRLQAQGGARPPPGAMYTMADAKAGRVLFRGSMDALKLIYKFEGGVSGMFRGFWPTLAREVPGNAAYFGVYALAKQQLAQAQGLDDAKQLSGLSLIAAGGIAGAAFWAPVLPIDTIKTRIQSESAHTARYRGLIDCALKVGRTEGWGALYKGWQPCLARSVPANAALFLVYERVQTALAD